MGSRYGGLKQLDGVGPHGETIMDYSVYDALRAGFGKVVFVIRKDFEEDFRRQVLSKYEGSAPVEVVFQGLDTLPEGYALPEYRKRPWGTGHAVLMGADVIKEPFAVINADDFYGREAFGVMAGYLTRHAEDKNAYCMVGFKVGNTLTENGTVSRGVCTVDARNRLRRIVERSKIGTNERGNIVYLDYDNTTEVMLDPSTPVSMNLWGFTPDFFDYSKREFKRFLDKFLSNPDREFYIPSVVDKLIGNNEASVQVLGTDSKWFGVTYANDRPTVCAALKALHDDGHYPDNLFN